MPQQNRNRTRSSGDKADQPGSRPSKARAGNEPGPNDQTSAATGIRARTEEVIEAAALELLNENGILAGLNLREVAERAGVNRALVYQYFGDRRGLLRSALFKAAARRPIWHHPRRATQQLVDRLLGDFREVVKARDQVRIVALLRLDNDDQGPVLDYPEESFSLLERDKSQGALPGDLEVRPFHILFISMLAGYSLFRDRIADEVGVTTHELDASMEQTIEIVVKHLGQ